MNDIIIIGGVIHNKKTVTFLEAKRYDKSLTEEKFNELLGIKKPVKKRLKKNLSDKSEKIKLSDKGK
jgi:hypothetical protein